MAAPRLDEQRSCSLIESGHSLQLRNVSIQPYRLFSAAYRTGISSAARSTRGTNRLPQNLKVVSSTSYTNTATWCSLEIIRSNALGTPIDGLVQYAFLMTCRDLAEFCSRLSTKSDIRALHYCTVKHLPKPSLQTWKTWENANAIDRQIAHLSYRRVTHPKPWVGHDGTNPALLQEFRTVFREFLYHVDDIDRAEFDRRLAERSKTVGLPPQ